MVTTLNANTFDNILRQIIVFVAMETILKPNATIHYISCAFWSNGINS